MDSEHTLVYMPEASFGHCAYASNQRNEEEEKKQRKLDRPLRERI